MTSVNTPSLQDLPELRRKTEAVSRILAEQLSGHLETLRPLFSPERLFGKHAGGKIEAPTGDKALADIQQAYRPFTAKPYDLPGSFDPSWLALVGQTLVLEAWEYDISVEGKKILMSSPVKWILIHRSNYSVRQVKNVLTGSEPVRLDFLRQFAVNALVLPLILSRYPRLVELLADLRWTLQVEKPPQLAGLPVVTATSFITSLRPPDNLILAATAFSGIPAFIELLDLSQIQTTRDSLLLRVEEALN